jgi:hypothetical protein
MRKTPPKPPETTNTAESAADATRRLATELISAQAQIKAMIESQDDYTEEIDDLRGIVTREYHYHRLRAEELKRELNNSGITV